MVWGLLMPMQIIARHIIGEIAVLQITNSIHFYSLSHDAACGRAWFVAQSAKMSAGNY